MELARAWQVIPSISFVSNFLDHELFIKAQTEIARKYLQEDEYDHILFSYHGIPESQIYKASVDNYCKIDQCCNTYHKKKPVLLPGTMLSYHPPHCPGTGYSAGKV